MIPDVVFCLLEQYLVDTADHPFAVTMLKHFEKLQTPLRSILKYPSLHSQLQRFYGAGFEVVEAKNLWEFWSDPKFLSLSQRLALDAIEPFDEWEEFALFASHYFLLTARMGSVICTRPREESPSSRSDVSTRTTLAPQSERPLYSLSFIESPAGRGRTHHASNLHLKGEAVAIHGGIGPQTRLGSAEVYGSRTTFIQKSSLPPQAVVPRSCHTITNLTNDQGILVGGRASPAVAMKDCWLQTSAGWTRTHDLPSPRYRHNAEPVTLPKGILGLLVFGGKYGSSSVHTTTLLWDHLNGWRTLSSLGDSPTPRFGAALLSLGGNYGICFGGMRQDGVILEDFWAWRLEMRRDEVLGIRFSLLSTCLDVSSGSYPYVGRLGAKVSSINKELVLIGGISRSGCLSKHYELLSVSGDFESLAETTTKPRLSISALAPYIRTSGPRPLLVGHESVSMKGQILIVGGGAVCFSFGTFWNHGIWVLQDIGLPEMPSFPSSKADSVKEWVMLDITSAQEADSSPERIVKAARIQQPSPVNRSRLDSGTAFTAIVRRAEPTLLEGVEFGPCTQLWNLEYLKQKVGIDRTVVVHCAQSRSMNFQKRDFSYMTQKFGEFADTVGRGGHLYLRSIASEKPSQRPANLSVDFPELSLDFRLPPELQIINTTFHSSPLRIGGGVNMWLHYDTMANVLCQVSGRKKMILYPPSDLQYLEFPPGSTTSRLDIFEGADAEARSIPQTHGQEALLNPGDVLFIPPLWSHTGAPVEGVNVAVNVFFRNLSTDEYAAGRDLYGNRDLRAYEDGRRDVDKIIRRFDRSIPLDITKAYLVRLADEIRSSADAMELA